MMAKGFQSVGWVAAVGGAALGCYMLSLNVAAERAELAKVEYRIIAAKQDIRSLQTELGTRGRLAQLDRWNAEVLALSAPTSAQYLENEFKLARFDQQEKTIDERAKVQLASAEAKPQSQLKPAAKPARKVAPADYAAAGDQASGESKPVVMRASYVAAAAKPLAPVKKASMVQDKMASALDKPERDEKKPEAGTGGQ